MTPTQQDTTRPVDPRVAADDTAQPAQDNQLGEQLLLRGGADAMRVPLPDDTQLATILTALRDHLADPGIPPVVTLAIHPGYRVSLQTRCGGRQPTDIADDLLRWSDSLTGVTVEACRTPTGDRVHIIVRGTIPGGVPVEVYGAIGHTPGGPGGDLAPDEATSWGLDDLRALTR